MSRELVIELAQAAGFTHNHAVLLVKLLTRFADLVVQETQERRHDPR